MHGMATEASAGWAPVFVNGTVTNPSSLGKIRCQSSFRQYGQQLPSVFSLKNLTKSSNRIWRAASSDALTGVGCGPDEGGLSVMKVSDSLRSPLEPAVGIA